MRSGGLTIRLVDGLRSLGYGRRIVYCCSHREGEWCEWCWWRGTRSCSSPPKPAREDLIPWWCICMSRGVEEDPPAVWDTWHLSQESTPVLHLPSSAFLFGSFCRGEPIYSCVILWNKITHVIFLNECKLSFQIIFCRLSFQTIFGKFENLLFQIICLLNLQNDIFFKIVHDGSILSWLSEFHSDVQGLVLFQADQLKQRFCHCQGVPSVLYRRRLWWSVQSGVDDSWRWI